MERPWKHVQPPGRSSVGRQGRLVADDLIRGKSGSSAQHPEFHAEKAGIIKKVVGPPSPTLNMTVPTLTT
jgi:hypothetical protein